ncbi:MAG: RnfABCDGE type electron transport complex subunit G [Lachnospiraceae bacterium]|nr:RnfABCDGE type electron transport complex subunit G [Lachnospiraceae bacterium]
MHNEEKKSGIGQMLAEAGILFAITLLSGILLGYVYELTKEPIRVQRENAIQEACRQVLPEAAQAGAEFRIIDYTPTEAQERQLAQNGVRIGTVYEAVAGDGSVTGYVVESTSSQGYGGKIVLYVGVSSDGQIGGVSVLEISETAGLGMEAPNVLMPQFAGRMAQNFTYTKSGSTSEAEVDAISGATITTKAVVNAVNGAVMTAQQWMQGGGTNE